VTAPSGLAQLWFGSFGGLVAWTAHLTIGYVLITAACVDGESRLGTLGLNAAFLGLTAGLAAVAALALVAAVRIWRHDEGWRAFMGFFGALLDALALGTIVLGGTQPLFLPPCA
jgi:hypothetical protein